MQQKTYADILQDALYYIYDNYPAVYGDLLVNDNFATKDAMYEKHGNTIYSDALLQKCTNDVIEIAQMKHYSVPQQCKINKDLATKFYNEVHNLFKFYINEQIQDGVCQTDTKSVERDLARCNLESINEKSNQVFPKH